MKFNSAKVAKGKDVNGQFVGISITLLVLPDDVATLPEPLRSSAERVLADHYFDEKSGGTR